MNKKIPIAIGIAVVIIGIIIVSSKAYYGDSKTELPAEEKIEKALSIEEKSTGNITPKAGEPEIGEANEAGEAGETKP
jgi:uncharacterized protein YpmB